MCRCYFIYRCRKCDCVYQEGAEHVEGDEINYSEATAACHLLPRVVVRLWVAQFPRHTGQHDLLPRFPGRTSAEHKFITQRFEKRLWNQTSGNLHTHLKRSSTAWGKVWKLLFLLMCVPSTMAIFPNTCSTNKTNTLTLEFKVLFYIPECYLKVTEWLSCKHFYNPVVRCEDISVVPFY